MSADHIVLHIEYVLLNKIKRKLVPLNNIKTKQNSTRNNRIKRYTVPTLSLSMQKYRNEFAV